MTKAAAAAIGWAVFATGCSIFVWLVCRKAQATIPLNVFDGSLDLIAQEYASRGLHPYCDFGIVYPPGALLWSALFGISGTAAIRFVESLVLLGIVSASVWLLWTLTTVRQLRPYAVGVLLLGTAATELAGIGTSISELLVFLVLLTARATRNDFPPPYAVSAAVAAALAVSWRWDRMIALLGMQVVAIFLTRLWARRAKGRLRTELSTPIASLKTVVWAECLGIGIAALGIISWLVHDGCLAQASTFVFALPAVMARFRALPLHVPRAILDANGAWLYCFFAIALSAIAWLRRRTKASATERLQHGVLLLLPIGFVPLAIHRTGYEHFVPLFLVTLAGVLVVWGRGLNRMSSIVALLPLCLFAAAGAKAHLPALLAPEVNEPKEIADAVAECQAMMAPLPRKSLFVGRWSYESFIVNNAVLYYTDIGIPPATAYISDEPGIQNSCFFGEQIAKQLTAAPKPMVVLLELLSQPSEPNATATMKSCGAIETVLADLPHADVGICWSQDRPLLLRTYGDEAALARSSFIDAQQQRLEVAKPSHLIVERVAALPSGAATAGTIDTVAVGPAGVFVVGWAPVHGGNRRILLHSNMEPAWASAIVQLRPDVARALGADAQERAGFVVYFAPDPSRDLSASRFWLGIADGDTVSIPPCAVPQCSVPPEIEVPVKTEVAAEALSSETEGGFIDNVEGRNDGALVVHGWAPVELKDGVHLSFVVDSAVRAARGRIIERPDVVKATGRTDLLRSGFFVELWIADTRASAPRVTGGLVVSDVTGKRTRLACAANICKSVRLPASNF
jgi:hypothetical protein